jgi:hypothetical protein
VWRGGGQRYPKPSRLKYEPLAAETIQQLLSYILPLNQLVDLHTRWPGASGYPLLYQHRQVDLNFVASQYLELVSAGGEAWETIGLRWNGRVRLLGFDFDYSDQPKPGKRGCNHPDNDGGAAEYALRTIVWEATGGDIVATTSSYGRGRWYFTVLPEGGNPFALASYILEMMAKKGFAVGPGCLEVPMGVARLPLAGYTLDDHADRPWIEQVGEFVNWVRNQSQLVMLRVALPAIDSPTTSEFKGFIAPSDRQGVDLGGLHFLLDEGKRSNAFLLAAASRFVLHGHDLFSVPLLIKQIELHPDWIAHASESSKRDLRRGWAHRVMVWALRTASTAQNERAALSNLERHQMWNQKVAEGIPLAMLDGCKSVTAVIAWLTKNKGMSKRLLWERVDLIRQGMQRVFVHPQEVGEISDPSLTPTQPRPVGVPTTHEDPAACGTEGQARSSARIALSPPETMATADQSDQLPLSKCCRSRPRNVFCVDQAARQPAWKAELTAANHCANRVCNDHASVGPPAG